MTDRHTEDLWRTLAPQVLAALVRRYGHFDEAEDAVQEALLAAATQWPRDGRPDDPRAWLITVAARRLVDRLRSESARERRELATAWADPTDAPPAVGAEDDTLTLLTLCCHPALSPPSQVALALRAVAGLTTAQIAHAYLVPEATMAQRVSRAKQAIRDAGDGSTSPRPPTSGRCSTCSTSCSTKGMHRRSVWGWSTCGSARRRSAWPGSRIRCGRRTARSPGCWRSCC